MRAFIFSLDAFVAFTLALIAIYSLIFFSSVPSSYYFLITQGHFLTRDVLMSLSTTVCTEEHVYGTCVSPGGSMLDNIISQDDPDQRENMIDTTIGDMVPDQFGYALEVSSDQGSSWSALYHTGEQAGDPHAKESKKLTVSSQVIAFDYAGVVNKPDETPYKYLSCGDPTDPNPVIITCGESGTFNPSESGDLVPSSDVKVVRLTVFI